MYPAYAQSKYLLLTSSDLSLSLLHHAFIKRGSHERQSRRNRFFLERVCEKQTEIPRKDSTIIPEKQQGVKKTPGKGCETYLWVSFYPHARYSQKSSHRLLKIQQRKAIILSAPWTVQCIPDCFSRCPITVRQPASTTPEPINSP